MSSSALTSVQSNSAFHSPLRTPAPTDECESVTVSGHSARALAAADRRAQCMEGAIERLVRPMLRTRSLTEEVQSVACFTDNDEWRFEDNPSLTQYAKAAALARKCNSVPCEEYIKYSGMDWTATTAQQRYDATTRLPHEDAMRLELDTYSRWVEDMLYVTLEEARGRPDLSCDGLRWSRAEPQAYFTDVLANASTFERMAHQLPDELYSLFRLRPNATPVSLLVLLEMHCLCGQSVLDELFDSRVELSEEDKERIATKAVADAEAAAREEARVKRRRTA